VNGSPLQPGERRPADSSCEEMAAAMFGQGLSPEEYAARLAHGWYCFSLGDYRYSDPAIDAWMQRLSDILFGFNGAPSVEELRLRFLTPEERLRIEKEMQEEF
jgi:hypothetical protein